MDRLPIPGSQELERRAIVVRLDKVGSCQSQSVSNEVLEAQAALTIVREDRLTIFVKVHEDGVEQGAGDVKTRVEVERKSTVSSISRSARVRQLSVQAHVARERCDRSALHINHASVDTSLLEPAKARTVFD